MRDVQKSKVYHAEDLFRVMLDRSLESPQVELAGSTLVLPPEAKFSTPETVQAYVDTVLEHPAVIARFGQKKISVRKRKGTTKAHYSYMRNEIAVPDDKWALREIVVLHEIAHSFTMGERHGPGFVSAFLDLIGIIMGVQARLAMRILFAENEVK